MDKKQREERRRQEDIALQRGLLWVAGAVLLGALLVLVNRFYLNYRLTDVEISIFLALDYWLRILRNAALAAAVLFLAWALLRLKQEKAFGWPLVGAIVLAAVAVCAHVAVKFQGPGMSMLFWLVAAWAVLALVYYIYQREFFLAASACGMSVLGLWFARYGAAGRLEFLLLAAAIFVVGIASAVLRKNDGALDSKGKLRFLPKDSSYLVLTVTTSASLLAMVAGMAAGGTAAYYLMFVMTAWLFALFVYYTVKLM